MTAAAQIAAWLAASSQNGRSPKGDTIPRGPFGELVSVGLDDVLPGAPAGCLPLFTLASGSMCPHGPRRKASNGLQTGRSTSTSFAGEGRPDFPPVAVLRVAAGATIRQACIAAGIAPEAPLVGIPAEAF